MLIVNLIDKTIIITGASSGIGAAAANLFANNGANVVLGARRQQELESLCNSINKGRGNAISLCGDVNDAKYANALVALALDQFNRLDGAFNNAGVMGELAQIPHMDESNWNAVVSTNLTSAFYACKAQIPALQSHGGSIVFTSSFVNCPY